MIVNPQRKIDQLAARVKEDLAEQKEELRKNDVLLKADMLHGLSNTYARDVFYIEYHPYEEWKHRLHIYHIPYIYRALEEVEGLPVLFYKTDREYLDLGKDGRFLCNPTFHRDDNEPRNVGHFSAYCPLEKLGEFKVQFYNFIKYFLQGITESMIENCEEDLDSLVNNPVVNSIRNRIEFATVKGEIND